jgi:CBS domain-containing protein
MSTPPVTVTTDATLYETIEVMLENHVGSAVVVDKSVAGILTRSDILRGAYVAGDALDDISVTRAMSEDVVTTRPSASIRTALDLMDENNIKKLPVLEDIELVGVVTATDIAAHQPERVREIKAQMDRQDDWTN